MCSTLLQQEAGVDWLYNPSLFLKSQGDVKEEKNLWLNMLMACILRQQNFQ